MPSIRSVATAALLGLAAVARADSLTCQSLKSTSSISIDEPLSIDYTSESNEYWSTGCAALKPACIIKPASAAEMSTVVKTLNRNNETFAVKSGGHNPNQNFSSIDGGPLISTADLNEVTLDAEAMTVRVGPGNRWEDVHKVLDGTNTTVVGGRIGNVGVGGYILGGGLSFLSAEYGWAANNLVEVELVLANGTIATASATQNADLFKALKGGGSNFGIVTTYTLKAHEMGDVWGGNLIFDASDETNTALLAALQNFTQNNADEKAGIILTSEITGANLVHIWVMFLFYDGPTPPAGVFDMFTSLDPAINNAKTRSYYDLLSFNDWAVLKGSSYIIATETTPLLAQNASSTAANTTVSHLQDCFDHWVSVSKANAAIPGLVASFAFQPYPAAFARKARSVDGAGGDLIALDEAADRIIFEFDFSYLRGLDSVDAAVDAATVELYGGMRDIVEAAVADGRAPDVYRPLFMNDGYFRQDYWGRIASASRTFAESVRDSVDPSGFWPSRSAGGFFL